MLEANCEKDKSTFFLYLFVYFLLLLFSSVHADAHGLIQNLVETLYHQVHGNYSLKKKVHRN